ncbi:ribokinase [Chitinophaga sp. XS-30]|uniref:ribokinase n=1 Tax=Chitinophaga sp. XS-30 TaxID=2604421 RepID=UPI0011DE37B2|nr:ribokinase [Chitinophaga sp. XS-30]QEH42191.1 ribokinase [Chitinophaga sp. XS-30]
MKSTIIQTTQNPRPRIVVAGSSATNMVIRAHNHPVPGEMVMGEQFFTTPGGKGANQAVTAARLGAAVTFLSKIGNDLFGRQAIQQLMEEGINTNHILSDQRLPSGVAFITVDADARSSMTIAPGANSAFLAHELPAATEAVRQADYLLLQLDIPEETVLQAARMAVAAGVPVMLDPSPAYACSDELLQQVTILTPNRIGASRLSGIQVTGMDSAVEAAGILYRKGVKAVVMTLGAEGALVLQGDQLSVIPAVAVSAVDTTAAGDVFNGALAVALAEHRSLQEAATFACRAAAIAITRWGAQTAAPYRREMEKKIFHTSSASV